MNVSQKSVTCGPPLREARAVNPFRSDLLIFLFVFRFYEIEKISRKSNFARPEGQGRAELPLK